MNEQITNREAFTKYISDEYGVSPDYPWQDDDTAVYRHQNNRKWFAIAMTIPRARLGLSGKEYIEVANLKCRPDMLEWLWEQNGVFPAYHMNKQHWVTVALDGSVAQDLLEGLIEMSFDLTSSK